MFDDDELDEVRGEDRRGEAEPRPRERRIRRFSVSFASSAVALALVFAVTSASLTAYAILPVTGIGGYYADIDSFEGNHSAIYNAVGETAECRSRPMLVMEFEEARMDGYSIFKDVKLPFPGDLWMTIGIEQPPGSYLTADKVTLFTTQAFAEDVSMYNVRIREGGGSQDFGRASDEFLMEADPLDQENPDITATNMTAWIHRTVADNITFRSGTADNIRVRVTFQNTSELRANRAPIQRKVPRESYFQCSPRDPMFVEEDFESGGAVPAGWTAANSAGVHDNTSLSRTYAAYTCCEADSRLVNDSIDLSTRFYPNVTAHYWVRKGANTFSDEPTHDLVVEYLNDAGSWQTLERFRHGDYAAGAKIHGGMAIPKDGLHAGFQLRFRQTGGSGADTEFWHIDDVEVE